MDENFTRNDLDEAVKNFATSLHNRWGVGNKENQNGILIFISVEDKILYVSTGSGVCEKINPDFIQNMISHMRPELRAGSFERAIEVAIAEIGNELIKNKKYPVVAYVLLTFAGLVFLSFIFFLIRDVYKRRKYRKRLEKGKGYVKKLMMDMERAANEQRVYASESCPVCFDDFIQKPNDPKRAMVLKCGHCFCYDCLQTFLSRAQFNKECPVCRKEIVPFEETDRSKENPEASSYEEHIPVFRFRLNRIRSLYPNLIEEYQFMTIMNHINQSNLAQAANARFAFSSIQTQVDLAISSSSFGSGASIGSFGGGISSGGGGGHF
jgi:uncharacterized membrane protein YgcG